MKTFYSLNVILSKVKWRKCEVTIYRSEKDIEKDVQSTVVIKERKYNKKKLIKLIKREKNRRKYMKLVKKDNWKKKK